MSAQVLVAWTLTWFLAGFFAALFIVWAALRRTRGW